MFKHSLITVLISGAATLAMAPALMAADAENRNEKAAATGNTSTSKTQKSQTSSSQQKSGQEAEAVVLLVPVDVTTQNQANKGCWARIYDRENYTGDMLTLVGPVQLADMSGPYGLDWDDRVNSIQVGPQATVTVFDDPLWQERVAQFKPNQKQADLSERLGFFDEFGSVSVTCNRA